MIYELGSMVQAYNKRGTGATLKENGRVHISGVYQSTCKSFLDRPYYLLYFHPEHPVFQMRFIEKSEAGAYRFNRKNRYQPHCDVKKFLSEKWSWSAGPIKLEWDEKTAILQLDVSDRVKARGGNVGVHLAPKKVPIILRKQGERTEQQSV